MWEGPRNVCERPRGGGKGSQAAMEAAGLVPGHVATHTAAAVDGPRSPRLRGCEAKVRGPVLYERQLASNRGREGRSK